MGRRTYGTYIVKDKQPRRDSAVKVMEVDGNLRKKLEYIFKTKAARSARHWDRLTDVKYYEFAKRYGVYVYDAGDGYRMYISVRKDATADEIVESLTSSKLDLDLLATMLERVISLTECDDELCKSVVELLRQIHAIATVLTQ